jgi:hypothetical protein
MSKLNDTDGVRLQPTQLGNIAVILPADFLDAPMFPTGGSVAELALVLDRDDARKLAAQLLVYARTPAE